MDDSELFNNIIKTYDFLIDISRDADFYNIQAGIAIENGDLKEAELMSNEYFNIISTAADFFPTVLIKESDFKFVNKETLKILLEKNKKITKIYLRLIKNSRSLMSGIAELTLDILMLEIT